MQWVMIITAILELLGPLIQDWLKKCTEEKLSEAAGHLPEPSTFASEGAAAAALFDEAIASLPRLAFIRRAALRRAKLAAIEGSTVRVRPLTESELEEGRDLVRGFRHE
jgi:hypothetical protein